MGLDSNRAVLARGCDPSSPSLGRVRRPFLRTVFVACRASVGAGCAVGERGRRGNLSRWAPRLVRAPAEHCHGQRLRAQTQRQVAQPRDLLLIHRRLPHHSALNQSALSTPIGDRNRSRLIGFRLASHDDHRDAALRTWGRGLQVARKLNNVVSTLPTPRSDRRRLRVWKTFLKLMTFPHKVGAALSTK